MKSIRFVRVVKSSSILFKSIVGNSFRIVFFVDLSGVVVIALLLFLLLLLLLTFGDDDNDGDSNWLDGTIIAVAEEVFNELDDADDTDGVFVVDVVDENEKEDEFLIFNSDIWDFKLFSISITSCSSKFGNRLSNLKTVSFYLQ